MIFDEIWLSTCFVTSRMNHIMTTAQKHILSAINFNFLIDFEWRIACWNVWNFGDKHSLWKSIPENLISFYYTFNFYFMKYQQYFTTGNEYSRQETKSTRWYTDGIFWIQYSWEVTPDCFQQGINNNKTVGQCRLRTVIGFDPLRWLESEM